MDAWDVRTLEMEAHSPQILRTGAEARVIVIDLPAGEELQEHQVHEHAHVFVIDGEVQIDGDGEVVSGGAGLLVHFEPAERHSVKALSATRLVLLLAPWPGEGHPSA